MSFNPLGKDLKKKAIALRKQGKSYSEIRELVDVSQSTLSLWLRSVELSPKQKRSLIERRLRGAWMSGGKANHDKRIANSLRTIEQSWKESRELSKDPFFVLGLGLYWAEGTKHDEHFRFTNSDPLMIQAFLIWLRRYCNVSESSIRAQLHIHSLHSRENAEEYWSRISGIPISQFIKTYIKQTSLGQRKNKLYEGTFVISLGSVELHRKVVGWKYGMLEANGVIHPSGHERKNMIKNLVENAKTRSRSSVG